MENTYRIILIQKFVFITSSAKEVIFLITSVYLKFYGEVLGGKRNNTSYYISVMIKIMIRPCQRFALSKFLEYEDCLWIFGGKGVSLDGYLNE